MKNISVARLLLLTLLTVSFLSCRKDGMHSKTAKKIQYRWERISNSSMTNYLDSYITPWTVKPAPPGLYIEFADNGYMYYISGSSTDKFQYKVDGDKILSVRNEGTRFTTPQYTDTAFIKQVDDHLLILQRRYYFLSTGYSYISESIDSLKK